MRELSEVQLIALVQNKAVTSAALVPVSSGWEVHVNGDQVLRSARAKVRHFARTDTALRYLHGLGIKHAEVELGAWPTEKLRTTRGS